MAQSYENLVIKRQSILERLKSGQRKEYIAELRGLEKLIRQTIGTLEDDVASMSATRLNKLLSDVRADSRAIIEKANDNLAKNEREIAIVSAQQEKQDLQATVEPKPPVKLLPQKELVASVLAKPLSTDGTLLSSLYRNYTNREVERITNTIRLGWTEGRTNQEIIRSVVGTKANNYKDGILETTRRNAATLVNTSVQHVASSARYETWENNDDVVKGYEWVSTLDSKTSTQCRTLDGQTFKLGKGPLPPIHPNCRSTTTAVLDSKYDFLNEGATRASDDGPVPADTTYYGWLKDQPYQDQVDILGQNRAKLLRDGGLSSDEFGRLQLDKNFEPLTLEEMRRMEPEAFEKAGL